MNRKLINGLLLLTVATGGVGTFTSCKDNEDSWRQETTQAQGQLFKILDDKIKNGDENLKVVRDKLNALLGAGLLTERNQEYLVDLINNNKNYAEQLKVYVDDMVMNLITNVQIEEVYNPAFGTINLPLGIQNGLLCNYYYQSDHAVQFPIANGAQYAGMGIYGDPEALDALDKAKLKPKNDEVKLGTEVQDIDRLGEIYVTVNPSTVPANALKGLVITLNKTNGEQVLGVLEAVKEDDHVKNFGYTRSRVNNGFYKIKVGVLAKDVPSINLNLDNNLKAAAKDFVKNPSKSDLLGLAEAIYKQFNNRIPALGLKFEVPVAQSFNYQATPWSSAPGGLLLPNITEVDGKYTTTGNTGVNDPNGEKGESGEIASDPEKNPLLRVIMSPYDIAAVTYHPLSYSFDPEGYVPDRRLPQIGHIQGYVDKILDKVNFELNLGIDPTKYNFNFDLSKVNFSINKTEIKIDLRKVPVYSKDSYNADGTLKDGAEPTGYIDGDKAEIVLGYDPASGAVNANGTADALNPLIDAIVKAVNGDGSEGSGFKGQMEEAVRTQLISQVNSLVNDLNDQLKSVNTTISDKITSIKEEIDNELNGRLGDGINRLIDLYNKIAQKVNTILDDPNAYMQVYAAYRDGNGDLHHLSTVASDPSIFTKGTGDAITLFLTSYNGELLAPAYKKYVAVVKDLDGGDITNANNASELNKVLDGRQQKAYIAVNDLTPGHTYQLVYTALDYRGNVSARSFYIKVAK